MATGRGAADVRQVIEYLSKKGYSRTEAMLRMESANTDREGRPVIQRVEDLGGDKYFKSFGEWSCEGFTSPLSFLSTTAILLNIG